MSLIKSISYCDGEILNNAISLHAPNNQIDLDPTYSKGNIYTKCLYTPRIKGDIDPKTPNVLYMDYTNFRTLTFRGTKIYTIVFDPPFLATKGPSLKVISKNNIISRRFGVYATEKELFQSYDKAMHNFYMILEKNGILIWKTQDKVSSGKQYWTHIYLHTIAKEEGFYPIDLFIKPVKNRIVAKWQIKNQKHARKYHSYYWVFKKK